MARNSRFKAGDNTNLSNNKSNLKGVNEKVADRFSHNRTLSNHSGNERLNSRPALLNKKSNIKVGKKSIPTNESRKDQFDSSRLAREIKLTQSDLNAERDVNNEVDDDQEFTVSDHILNDSVYLQKRPNFRATNPNIEGDSSSRAEPRVLDYLSQTTYNRPAGHHRGSHSIEPQTRNDSTSNQKAKQQKNQ